MSEGNKPEILVLGRIYAPTLTALEQAYTVRRLWSAADPDLLLRETGHTIRAAVTTSVIGFNKSYFEKLPNLELVACFGIGHRAIDLATAEERGVIVANTPDAIADSVADLGVGLIIAVMRRICETDRFVRAGHWLTRLPPLGTELSGKTCGIVGLGQIGLAVAKRIAAFGMSVCYHGPHRKPDAGYLFYDSLDAMAKASDCLVVSCALTPQTRHLVDRRILDALGPQGVLVNVARGAIVEEKALIEALKDRRVAGAGLDVFWDEPNVPPELITMDEVVVVPHIGSSTLEIRERRGRHLLANLAAHFAGEPVPFRLQ